MVSDLVGEKLNEAFVSQCLEGLQGFRMLIPSTEPELRYLLVMDEARSKPDLTAIRSIEMRLEGNLQYAHARHLGQLGALEHLSVRDPLAKYMARSKLYTSRPVVASARANRHWPSDHRRSGFLREECQLNRSSNP